MLKFLACAACAACVTSVAHADLAETIDSMAEPYTRLRDFSGVIVVAEDGEVIYERGFGRASFEHDVSNTTDTVFMIGSISKQFTAAAVLLLETDGALAVTDAIERYLPDFPRGSEITIHHLLTHTSGVADIYSLPEYTTLNLADPPLADVVSRLAALPLTSEPGTDYLYSNGGYALLAAVVEQASGLPFADFLDRRIFDPLAMAHTGALRDRRFIPGLATGYDPIGDTDLRVANPVSPTLYTGSGSIYSSANDLLRWDRALRGDVFLPDSSRTKMMTRHASGYGYGVSVYTRFDGTVIEHDGRMPGYASDLARYVDRDATVIILGNIQSAMRDRFRDDIASLLHGHEVTPRVIRSSASGKSPAVSPALGGVYAFGPSMTVTVRSAGDRLFIRANAGEELEFAPVGDGTFFSRTLYAAAAFEENESGEVVAMQYMREGQSFRGERASAAPVR